MNKGSLFLGTTSVSSFRNFKLSTINDCIDPFFWWNEFFLERTILSRNGSFSSSLSNSSLRLRNLLVFFSLKRLIDWLVEMASFYVSSYNLDGPRCFWRLLASCCSKLWILLFDSSSSISFFLLSSEELLRF